MQFTYKSSGVNEYKRFKIDNFLGVDFASTKINANKSRAVEMKNFINRDGVNHKRYGWNEVAKFTDELGNTLPINGFWFYKDSNNVEHKIVHAGTKLFKITNLGANSFETTYEEIDTSAISDKILNQRSFGIVRGDFLYLFLGKVYAMYGKWSNSQYEVRKVEDGEKTYIPTTTIGISAIGSSINSRQSLEEVNLLTSKRRNKLIGELISSENVRHNLEDMINNAYFEGSTKYAGAETKKGYVINNITYDGIEEIEIEIKTISNATITKTFPVIKDDINRNYTLDVGSAEYIYDIAIKCNTNHKLTATIYIGSFEESEIKAYVLSKRISYQLDTKGITLESVKINGITMTYPSSSITFDGVNGIITFDKTLLEEYPPAIEGESNIVVEFSKEIEGNADKINNCRFGIIFGYNDLENLFVSGNPNLPNMDFHSTIPDSTETTSGIPIYDDLTYFGDLGYAVLGSKQSKVMGYTLLEDGTLAIHKEAYKNDPSIYIRTATLDNVVDLSGNIVYDPNGNPYKRVVYPHFAGNISEGMITPFASSNLAGDKLFLSKNGVFGIVMNKNIKSNERFARERSRLINPKLVREKDLENACAISFDNRYYLAINGKCYVADSRFKNQYAPEMDDTFSYEWWLWDNIPARIWFVHEGILGFGTEKGQICLFDNEDFVDVAYVSISNGGLMFDIETNTFTINSMYDEVISKLGNNDYITISTSGSVHLGELILTSNNLISVKHGKIKVSENVFYSKIRFLENEIVNIEHNDYMNIDYIIKNIDYSDYSFELHRKDTNVIGDDIHDIVFSMVRLLEHQKVYIKNYDSELGTFQLTNGIIDFETNEEITLELVNYPSDQVVNNADLIGYFNLKENVKTFWATPMFDCGTSEYAKNLDTISIVPEIVKNGKMTFGYRTKEVENQSEVVTKQIEGSNFLDFNDIDFTNFTFLTSDFAKSFTKKTKVKNFNYIQFYFKSDDARDCAVNNISFTYSISRVNRGVK